MLRAIIQYYNAILASTGLLEKTCGLAELVEKDGVQFPIIYESGNEFSAVSAYDQNKGLSYWRITDPQTITDADSSRQMRACDKLKLVTYNMKLVAGIPRDISECDDEFCKQDIADRFVRFLADSESTIKNSVNAARVNVTVSNIDTNTSNIENDEYRGQDQTLPSSFIFIQMSVEVEIQIRKSCLEDQCNDPIVLPLPCPEGADINVSNSDDSYDVDTNTDLELPDNQIESSAANFTDTVPAADPNPYIIADVNWTDTDGTAKTSEYSTAIICEQHTSSIQFNFVPTADTTYVYTIVSDEAGDYDLDNPTFVNATACVFNINGSPETGTQTLEAGDTLQMIPTITTPSNLASVKIDTV